MIACKDCKHSTSADGWRCNHRKVVTDDPIYGFTATDCRIARSDIGKCRPEAKFFEKKVWLEVPSAKFLRVVKP